MDKTKNSTERRKATHNPPHPEYEHHDLAIPSDDSDSELSDAASTVSTALFVTAHGQEQSKKRPSSNELGGADTKRSRSAALIPPNPYADSSASHHSLASDPGAADDVPVVKAELDSLSHDTKNFADEPTSKVAFAWFDDIQETLSPLLSGLRTLLHSEKLSQTSRGLIEEVCQNAHPGLLSGGRVTDATTGVSGMLHAMWLGFVSAIVESSASVVRDFSGPEDDTCSHGATQKIDREKSLSMQLEDAKALASMQATVWSKKVLMLQNQLKTFNSEEYIAKLTKIGNLEQELKAVSDKLKNERKLKNEKSVEIRALKLELRPLRTEIQQCQTTIAKREADLQKAENRLNDLQTTQAEHVQTQKLHYQMAMKQIHIEHQEALDAGVEVMGGLRSELRASEQEIQRLKAVNEHKHALYQHCMAEKAQVERAQRVSAMAIESGRAANAKEQSRLQAWAGDISAKESAIKHNEVELDAKHKRLLYKLTSTEAELLVLRSVAQHCEQCKASLHHGHSSTQDLVHTTNMNTSSPSNHQQMSSETIQDQLGPPFNYQSESIADPQDDETALTQPPSPARSSNYETAPEQQAPVVNGPPAGAAALATDYDEEEDQRMLFPDA